MKDCRYCTFCAIKSDNEIFCNIRGDIFNPIEGYKCRHFVKESKKIICVICNNEIFDGRKYKTTGSGYSHQECKIDLFEPSELEMLRSENALLSERVKELDEIDEKNKRQIELLRFRTNELTEKLNVASENNHQIGKSNIRLEERINELEKINEEWYKRSGNDFKIANKLKAELSALKESKTVYVRRYKR